MYGGLAHLNPKKIERFFRLTKMGAASAFVFFDFISLLKELMKVLSGIREINVGLLNHLHQLNEGTN